MKKIKENFKELLWDAEMFIPLFVKILIAAAIYVKFVHYLQLIFR